MQQEFISGVHLLSTDAHYSIKPNILLVAIVIAMIVFGLTLALSKKGGWHMILLPMFVFTVIMIVLTSEQLKPKTMRIFTTRYKVMIDESVKFKEFTEKYEVMGREGDIYTIRILEEDDK